MKVMWGLTLCLCKKILNEEKNKKYLKIKVKL